MKCWTWQSIDMSILPTKGVSTKIKQKHFGVRIQSRALWKERKKLICALLWLTHRIAWTSLRWHTRIGLDDAALTAMSTGLLWGVLGNVVALLRCCFESLPMRIDLSVRPTYGPGELTTEIDGCIRSRVWELLAGGIRLGMIVLTSSQKPLRIKVPRWPFSRDRKHYA